jgi:hypothetical protein
MTSSIDAPRTDTRSRCDTARYIPDRHCRGVPSERRRAPAGRAPRSQRGLRAAPARAGARARAHRRHFHVANDEARCRNGPDSRAHSVRSWACLNPAAAGVSRRAGRPCDQLESRGRRPGHLRLWDAHRDVGQGPGSTWRPSRLEFLPFGILRIDHLLGGPRTRPLSVGEDCTPRGSDHCILMGSIAVD